MTETSGVGEAAEAVHEAVGAAKAGLHAGEAIGHAVEGEWDKAADSSVSTSESALGVATFGVSELVEEGWDGYAKEHGLPSAHEAIVEGTHAVGDALGDGLFDLVGEEQSHKAAMDFDDGHYLSGVGHMLEGAAETVGGAIEHGASAVGGAIEHGLSDAFHAVSDAISPPEPTAPDVDIPLEPEAAPGAG